MEDAQCSRYTRKTFIVPDIKSFDHYDFARAKIACSLTWLVAKAFGSDCIPVELEQPLYKDQYDQEHLKPQVASLLLSAELYCRAGSLILRSDAARPLLGHNGVIQALAQKGLYVTDQERLVTERDLCKTPIQMSSHLAMIDTLMMAYTVEMISVERVLTCVQKYSSLFPEEDFPYDAEEAVTTWINKVNGYLRETMTHAKRVGKNFQGKSTGQKEDIKTQPALYLPLVDNLLKDNTDGCALATLLHFYCPNLVPFEDICVKTTMSLADSLYNLQLIQDFCRKNLNNCCHFTLEDLLYASSSIKSNYLVFMAELFWWFEVVKPSFVQPCTLETKFEATEMAPITKRNLIHRPPSPDLPKSPNTTSSDMIERSNSQSYVEGYVGTWPKEKRFSAHGISFEIPFHDPVACTSSKRLTRSASSEGLGFSVSSSVRGMRRNLSFQPINGSMQSPLQEEASNVISHHGPLRPPVGTDFRYLNWVHPEVTSPQLLTPSIEEALKIIQEPERSNSSVCHPVGQNAFFLHPPEVHGHASGSDLQEPEDNMSKSRIDVGQPNSTSTDMDTGIHVCTEDIQDGHDEDSSLRDYSDMDQDYEACSCPLPDTGGSFSPVLSPKGQHSLAASSTSSVGSSFPVRMTNFAEQKIRKLNHGEGRNDGHTIEADICTTTARQIARSVTPDDQSQASLPRDPSSLLVSEMVQLKMKLEEKRRAIEAQKKKVEAAFTQQRQKMGRTAFLNVVRRKGTVSSVEGDNGACKSLNEKQNNEPQLLQTNKKNLQLERGKPVWTPATLTSVKGGSAEGVDFSEYTRSIERLNASLIFLQTEMQRLSQQQEHIMRLREQQAYVISPSHMRAQTSLQKHLCEMRSSSAMGRKSVGSLSPNLSTKGSPRTTQCSPTPIKRKSASFHARTPRTPRLSELKVTPFCRMLNTAQSVDSLPRLRRFSQRQTQTSSFAYLGHNEEPTHENHTNEEDVTALSMACTEKQPDTDVSSNQVIEIQEEEKEKEDEKHDVNEKLSKVSGPVKTTAAFQVQSQLLKEKMDLIGTNSTGDRKDLIEVPLSELKPMDDHKLISGKVTVDRVEKICCGFFYRDDQKGEEDIAQKKAALLEKRLRREKEMKMKKLLLEQEMEQKKEMSRLKAEEDCLKKEEEKSRREFIKNEYLRKRQLKLMEDMDSVIKPRPPSVKQKKPRPKSMHRENMDSPKKPAQTHTVSRPRGYSVSSISLASLNLADNESVNTDKRMPRQKITDGPLSSFPTVSQNGDNWENESTSSAASNTDYTGPKLYKEPSARSNKYIIQNALAHCCLAGKVNEGQKNKILEEMEKTESYNFLILFRDSGCQFRSLYTYCPETKEISKLAGIGPKTIMPRMIENLYKYSSDKKQFCHIPAKTMSASVDAITIYNHLWQTKKQSTPNKLLK
ncbi:Calmodulin-regulated spectrin-associated protein 2 [Bagarius yarrelli]|uniref:Calmodulin-regulated spectrin-associated protein 2 n=1 Tax=Bagarius yarrelli TaxID=175774 RepID=A0A556V7J1_BAGYA|nr:Calmodulin-regulated spectrin-associated protein 2 [Bagarius yarrelli]